MANGLRGRCGRPAARCWNRNGWINHSLINGESGEQGRSDGDKISFINSLPPACPPSFVPLFLDSCLARPRLRSASSSLFFGFLPCVCFLVTDCLTRDSGLFPSPCS
ncbi:hypothetical protein SEVIR_1G175900v4 [Setaria viridis]|uniref:Uncharacterized protein n=1 Tax=Setaria viridis TaxID=4556 RepID=A0A4U6W9P0_SETVI|nr:hypothetical protein SEVIR_1G175900v2 [Setaria viridis]